jgi:glycosyltransferase involved in cell wall biosynthesis
MGNRNLKIAILGSQGIPAKFGGFETFAEQLATRLAQKEFSVTVFCEVESGNRPPSYKGVSLHYGKTPKVTALRSIWFDTVCIIKSLRKYDIIYMLGYHVALAFFLPVLFGDTLVVNMDGMEWKRTKWSSFAQKYLRLMEYLAAKWSTILVADAEGIADYLKKEYGHPDKVVMIPYGADIITTPPDPERIAPYGLEAGSYYLVVCRLEPENHVLEIIRGFVDTSSKRKLVIVGDYQADTPYTKSLTAQEDERIVFLGSIYDQEQLTALRCHCYAYLHGHSVGGTNPSLLEAMACGNFVVAHNNVFNREVTENNGWYFTDSKELQQLVEKLEAEGPPPQAPALFREIMDRKYNWDIIADRYASIFHKIFAKKNNLK